MGSEKIDFHLLNSVSDPSVHCSTYNTAGIKNRNITTPVMRWKIETSPGIGKFNKLRS